MKGSVIKLPTKPPTAPLTPNCKAFLRADRFLFKVHLVKNYSEIWLQARKSAFPIAPEPSPPAISLPCEGQIFEPQPPPATKSQSIYRLHSLLWDNHNVFVNVIFPPKTEKEYYKLLQHYSECEHNASKYLPEVVASKERSRPQRQSLDRHLTDLLQSRSQILQI